MVVVPFTNLLAPSDMSVPETVMTGALDVSVTPATAMVPDGRAVKVWPRVVQTEDDGKAGRTSGVVDVPATKPLDPNDSKVEETVMAGALAVRVVPATTMPLGRRVRRWPAAVVMIAGSAGLGGVMGMVLEPMCRAEEPRETMVLSTAKPGSPAAWVVRAARSRDEERVMVWLPTVK